MPQREQARGVTSYETDLLRRKNSKACSTQQQRPYKHGLFFLQLTRDVQASFRLYYDTTVRTRLMNAVHSWDMKERTNTRWFAARV